MGEEGEGEGVGVSVPEQEVRGHLLRKMLGRFGGLRQVRHYRHLPYSARTRFRKLANARCSNGSARDLR